MVAILLLGLALSPASIRLIQFMSQCTGKFPELRGARQIGKLEALECQLRFKSLSASLLKNKCNDRQCLEQQHEKHSADFNPVSPPRRHFVVLDFGICGNKIGVYASMQDTMPIDERAVHYQA